MHHFYREEQEVMSGMILSSEAEIDGRHQHRRASYPLFLSDARFGIGLQLSRMLGIKRVRVLSWRRSIVEYVNGSIAH